MFYQQRKRPALLTILLYAILLTGAATTTGAYTIVGNVGSYASDDHSITFKCENARVKLSFLTVRMFMLRDIKEAQKTARTIQSLVKDPNSILLKYAAMILSIDANNPPSPK